MGAPASPVWAHITHLAIHKSGNLWRSMPLFGGFRPSPANIVFLWRTMSIHGVQGWLTMPTYDDLRPSTAISVIF